MLMKIEQFYKSKVDSIVSIIEEDYESKAKSDFENMRAYLESEMTNKLNS